MEPTTKILVVDDDEDARDILSEALVGAGFGVETACDVREALQKLHSAPPSLIVSDLQMPGLTGLDLIRTLREHGLAVPVLLLTGAETQDLCTCAAKYGAAACLTKPADLDDLIWNMDMALARAASSNTPL